MWRNTIVYLLCAGVFRSCRSEISPEVTVKNGIVRGFVSESYGGRKFLSFLGIPYAEPPVGDLRFADPTPASNWDGILDANKTYSCAQLLPIPIIWGPSGTEDCLYLYVYVPGETVDTSANLPVIVHIHGGAFMIGSPKMMALPDFLMDQDVIYVTMNYRLGILGFLSTEDDTVPGNMGLKDQSMALKWIKENIAAFGGNPDSITITGLSAGGASVHYHYLAPMSQGLFARGFSQSGTALQSWALTEYPLEKAKFVARNVSCETDSTEKMVACLRSTSVKDLLIGIDGLFVLISGLPCTPFGPVVEKHGSNIFLPDYPYKLMKEGKIYDVPWINSNVQDEGIFPVGFLMHLQKMDYLIENWNKLMPYALDLQDTVEESKKEDLMNKLTEFYYKGEEVTSKNYEILIKVFNDRLFFIDSELATRTQAKMNKSPVYVYKYRFLPENNFFFKNMKPGVSHGLDGKLLYKWIFLGNIRGKEVDMMKKMTEFLKTYATEGVPEIGGVKWEPVDPDDEDLKYMEINGPDNFEMKKTKEQAPTDFWKSLPIQENNHLF